MHDYFILQGADLPSLRVRLFVEDEEQAKIAFSRFPPLSVLVEKGPLGLYVLAWNGPIDLGPSPLLLDHFQFFDRVIDLFKQRTFLWS